MTFSSRLARASLLLAAFAACSGSSQRPDDQPAGADPVVETRSLEVMIQGLFVQVQLRARVAAEPAAWTFDVDRPQSLAWLSLTPDGLLSGTPAAVLRPAEQVRLRVTDASGRSATVTLPVEVHGCDPAAHPYGQACFAPSGENGCTQATAFCVDGAFGPCSGGASVDPGHCGSMCSPCPENTADRCSGGTTCQCGQGPACTGAHAASFSCTGGACVNECELLFGDCDADRANGCEQPLRTSTHCGQCGGRCDATAHTTADCTAGSCARTCVAGWGDCDGAIGSNGCETPLNGDAHCGACNRPCTPAANTTASCATGSCVRTCSGGWGDCDGAMDSNGCETPLDTVARCGACNVQCVAPVNGTVSCQAGGCVPACPANSTDAGGTCTCGAGWGNCDGDWGNGCETRIDANDVNNCGGCNVRCTAPAGGSASCQAGGCVPACPPNSANAGGTCTCGAGWGNCDGNLGNGCETGLAPAGSTAGTISNCGQCGSSCVAPTGGTASCATGACVPSCPGGMTVSGGACVCPAGYSPCGGGCANFSVDVNNCGSCGNSCPADSLGERVRSCASGACGLRCPTGTKWCASDATCIPSASTCFVEPPPCFVAGTPVTLADGSLRAIEEIAPGDEVLAMDPDTGELAAATVDQLLVHRDSPELLVVNGRIVTTPDHRFFVDGAWVAAAQLRPGDVLYTATRDLLGFAVGGEVVASLERLEGGVTTYNLEVRALHDYFAGGVLVHNAKNIP